MRKLLIVIGMMHLFFVAPERTQAQRPSPEIYRMRLQSLFAAMPNALDTVPAGKPVTIVSGDHRLSATLFEPSGPGPFPAVLEIHGINGYEQWDSDVSQKLAEAGYVTLAVDYYGRPARNYEDGLHLRDQLRPHLAQDLLASVQYLRNLKEVSPDRVGALGWCMGGGFVLQLAIADAKLVAGVIYYGPVTVDEDQIQKIHAHLLGYFGQEDRSISVPAIKMLANAMQEDGNPMELHIIPEARHGFAQPAYGSSSNSYMPDVAAEAWKNTLAFLNANLGGKKD